MIYQDENYWNSLLKIVIRDGLTRLHKEQEMELLLEYIELMDEPIFKNS